MSETYAIAYAAYTKGYTFLLDEDGICRRVMISVEGKVEPGGVSIAERCVGAQYIASLDVSVTGGLVKDPKVGVPLLFARVEDGRVALVRTAPLERFETIEDPAVARRYSDAVETQEIAALSEESLLEVRSVDSAPETEADLEQEVDTGELSGVSRLPKADDDDDDTEELATNEIPRGYEGSAGTRPSVRTRIVAPPPRPHPLAAGSRHRPGFQPPPVRSTTDSESRLAVPSLRR